MKARPIQIIDSRYIDCKPDEATHVLIRIPNPNNEHVTRLLPVQIGGARNDTGNWSWNGSKEKPTLKPSVLTQAGPFRCHTFVNDGMVQFLNDCSHENKGKTLPLMEI